MDVVFKLFLLVLMVCVATMAGIGTYVLCKHWLNSLKEQQAKGRW